MHDHVGHHSQSLGQQQGRRGTGTCETELRDLKKSPQPEEEEQGWRKGQRACWHWRPLCTLGLALVLLLAGSGFFPCPLSRGKVSAVGTAPSLPPTHSLGNSPKPPESQALVLGPENRSQPPDCTDVVGKAGGKEVNTMGVPDRGRFHKELDGRRHE